MARDVYEAMETGAAKPVGAPHHARPLAISTPRSGRRPMRKGLTARIDKRADAPLAVAQATSCARLGHGAASLPHGAQNVLICGASILKGQGL